MSLQMRNCVLWNAFICGILNQVLAISHRIFETRRYKTEWMIWWGQRISVFNRRKQENKWFKRSNKSNQLISSSLKNLVFYCSFQFNIKKTRHVFNVGRYLTYKISTFKYLTCVSESIKPVTIQEIKRWTTKNRSNAMMQCWMVHYSSIYIFRFPHRCFELRAFRVCHVKWFQERERE